MASGQRPRRASVDLPSVEHVSRPRRASGCRATDLLECGGLSRTPPNCSPRRLCGDDGGGDLSPGWSPLARKPSAGGRGPCCCGGGPGLDIPRRRRDSLAPGGAAHLQGVLSSSCAASFCSGGAMGAGTSGQSNLVRMRSSPMGQSAPSLSPTLVSARGFRFGAETTNRHQPATEHAWPFSTASSTRHPTTCRACCWPL
ncbi:microtubule-associated serine/threonine-protein kinase 3 isoform X4 [Ixodes scapularis]